MPEPKLSREIGVFGAVMLGLGSIIGTGAFVAIGIAAGISGSFLIISILIASGLALCNALSSAQLAANHPVSGGTCEYGRKYLDNLTGFIAGWLFICAKSASAAAAAMGFSGYLLSLFDLSSSVFLTLGALTTVVILSIVVFSGIKRANSVNTVIVLTTLVSLFIFILFEVLFLSEKSVYNIDVVGRFSDEFFTNTVFYGSALMFVAFTGYGRIATLGEEVKNPRDTIPKSILITLLISTVLYLIYWNHRCEDFDPMGFCKSVRRHFSAS